MTLADLIKHHEEGARACRAYADTPNASDPKTKDIAKHYEKKADWHEKAIELLQVLCQSRPPASK